MGFWAPPLSLVLESSKIAQNDRNKIAQLFFQLNVFPSVVEKFENGQNAIFCLFRVVYFGNIASWNTRGTLLIFF